ncbi:hypothetical protein ES702_02380 [subsurface metagenome]
MNPDMEKIKGIIDEHQGHLKSIGDGITEGLWDGIKEGVTEGSKKGARDGLRECLEQGFMNIGEGTIEDVVAYISESAISRKAIKGTSHTIESSFKRYLDTLSDSIIDRIRGKELVLPLDHMESVVELTKLRQQIIGQMIGEKLPHNPLCSSVVAGVQTALDEALDRKIQDFSTKIQEAVESGAESPKEKLQRPTRDYQVEQEREYIKAPIKDSVAKIVETIISDVIRQITKRLIANLQKELKEKSIRVLEKALENITEQKLEQGLNKSINLLMDKIAQNSGDRMSFAADIDRSFGGSLKDYLSSLSKGPRFPLWKGLLIGAGILAIAGLVYALSTGNEYPEAVASVGWTEGLTVGFSSEGSHTPDGYIESYYWDFGDGHASEEPNPTHTYQETGEYTAILTVTDDEGAIGKDTAYVYIGNGLSLPDLVITEAKFEWDPRERVVVYYYIRNQGGAVAAPSVTHLYIGDEWLSEDAVNSLAPGEVAIGEFPAFKLTGDQISRLRLLADVANSVIEINEENNSMAHVEPP